MNQEIFRVPGPVLVLVGPTAIGKTRLSLEIAEKFGCEIISMDSMQVYRFMDIGTAKVKHDEMNGITHHCIDIRNPDEQYDAAAFVQDALEAIDRISRRGRVPLVTGGTGLYLRALVHGLFDSVLASPELRQRLTERLQAEGRDGLFKDLEEQDPVSAKRIHINDTQRLIRALEIYYTSGVPWSEYLSRHEKSHEFGAMLQVGLQTERHVLHERINQRSAAMFTQGLVEETEKLMSMGFSKELPSMRAIGYRHSVSMLEGVYSKDQATETLARDTRRYAKRQMTWFRAEKDLIWYEVHDKSLIHARVSEFLQRNFN